MKAIELNSLKKLPALVELISNHDIQDSLLDMYITDMRKTIGNIAIMRIMDVVEQEVIDNTLDTLANILGWMQHLDEELSIAELQLEETHE